MKKLITAVSPFLLGGMAFAEGAAGGAGGAGTAINIDTQPVVDIVNGVKDWVDKITPVVLVVVGSFLAFWAVKFVIGLIKSIGNKSK